MAHLKAVKAKRQVVQRDISVQQRELLRQITEIEEKLWGDGGGAIAF